MKAMTKQMERESGIELLRIITMMGVILLHYNDERAFVYVADNSISQYLLFFFESMAICAVDLFILISGYFLSCTQKRTVLKPFQLLLQVILFREAMYIVSVLLQKQDFLITKVVANLIPNNYFVILYCALYFISPYINIIFDRLAPNQRRILMLTMIILFSLWTTGVDLFEEITGTEWMGLSTVTAWGSMQGFSIVNFALVYCIGCYIRKTEIIISMRKRIILWLMTIALIFVWAVVTQHLTMFELRSAWVYHNPLVLFSAVLLFLIFRDIHIKSRVINDLSAASFTCFLFHGYLLDHIGIQKAVESTALKMTGHIFISVPLIYLFCWGIHKVYFFSTNWFFDRLKQLSFFKPKEI